MTSSDRGDAGSTRSQRSARSKASDIPGQRGGGAGAGAQTLRILVLGGSAAADELRRQAADAGAELAQRFSARVTHVVTEPGIAADDSRVAKALAADLPVLTVDECAQLMGFCEVPTGVVVPGVVVPGVDVPGVVVDLAGAGASVGTAARIPAQPAGKAKQRVGAGESVVEGDARPAEPADAAEAERSEEQSEQQESVAGAEQRDARGSTAAAERGGEQGELRESVAEAERSEGQEGSAEAERSEEREGSAEAELGAGRSLELESVAEVRLEAARDSVVEVAELEGEAESEETLEAERALYVERVELAQYSGGEADVAVAEEPYDSAEQLVEAELTSSFAEVRALAEGRDAEHEREREQEKEVLGTSVVGVVGESSSLNYSPVEGMFGSALDAALMFPPLPISASESLTFENDYLIDSYADAPVVAESVQPIDRVGWIGQVESVPERVEELNEVKGLGSGESSEDKEEADGELIDLLDLNNVTDEEAAAQAAERNQKVASYAWAAVPFASLGLLTPASMGYAAYRQRSRSLGGVAAGYLTAVGVAFAISAGARGGTRTQSALGGLLTVCFVASWIGGTVHSLLIRRRVFGRSE